MAEPDKQPSTGFSVEKIYIKDVSYEAPGVPLVFSQSQNAGAEIGVQLGLEHATLAAEQGLYEVALTITATARRENKNIFLVEVKQAGIFRIGGVDPETLQRALEISCANVLLPFAREQQCQRRAPGSGPEDGDGGFGVAGHGIEREERGVTREG